MLRRSRGTQAPPDSSKLLGLEVVRFATAVAVLLSHYKHFSYLGGQLVAFANEEQPFYSALAVLYDYGGWGVQVFWCISGYIFFWKYKDSISSRVVGGRDFFVLRFSRLYPLHFATLIVVAILQPIYFSINASYFVYQQNDLQHFLLQLPMASNWDIGIESGFGFNGPIWSVSVEVLIYFIFFGALRIGVRSMFADAGIVALFCVARLLGNFHPVLECLGWFYLGGFTAPAGKVVANSPQRNAVAMIAWSIVCLIGPLTLYAISTRKTGGLYFAVMVYVSALLYCATADWRLGARVSRLIEAAGSMTYSSYLLHFPLQLALAIYFSHKREVIPFREPMFFWTYIVAVLVASLIVYRRFEAPVQRLIRNRFLYKGRLPQSPRART